MSEIKKEDYVEPRCVLCKPTEIKPIAIGRVIEKLDSYLEKNDYESAKRHLAYWLREAEAGNDIRGGLAVLNEQVGLYRKLGMEKECLDAAESALSIASGSEFAGTITLGTTYVNVATGYKAFGKAEKALPFYEKAKRLYESQLKPEDSRLGGLYNNMALALSDLKRYDEAEDAYRKALGVMEKAENGEAEIAITYLNLCDLITAKLGLEEGEGQINEYLDLAEKYLDTPTLPRNGYYAYVCEKCGPVFGYYGRFLLAEKYGEIARKIYEGA